jgi:phosphatidylglycerol---prolipoprotein diacylglyceryl transferase
MAILNFIIWNGSPEILNLGSFSLRWYGLFFALGFLISQQIMYYMYKKEGKPEKDVDTLTIYMVVATILGARLGHIIFYQPEIIWQDPLSIFLPFEFSPFRFVGLQGLASHGAAIGILTALWLYSRKKLPGQNFMQVVDRIVIVVALTGALIRLGNYFNSEIIGLPTDNKIGVVFVNKLTEAVKDQDGEQKIIESIAYHHNDSIPIASGGRIPLSMYVFFENGVDKGEANAVMSYARSMAYRYDEFFDRTAQFDYDLAVQEDGSLGGKLSLVGIARHPAQLYESISCVFLFIVLFLIWRKYKEALPTGLLFGIFLIVCFGLRISYEFVKENQEAFENNLPLNMGQILSIPLVIAGIVIVALALKRGRNPQNS